MRAPKTRGSAWRWPHEVCSALSPSTRALAHTHTHAVAAHSGSMRLNRPPKEDRLRSLVDAQADREGAAAACAGHASRTNCPRRRQSNHRSAPASGRSSLARSPPWLRGRAPSSSRSGRMRSEKDMPPTGCPCPRGHRADTWRRAGRLFPRPPAANGSPPRRAPLGGGTSRGGGPSTGSVPKPRLWPAIRPPAPGAPSQERLLHRLHFNTCPASLLGPRCYVCSAFGCHAAAPRAWPAAV